MIDRSAAIPLTWTHGANSEMLSVNTPALGLKCVNAVMKVPVTSCVAMLPVKLALPAPSVKANAFPRKFGPCGVSHSKLLYKPIVNELLGSELIVPMMVVPDPSLVAEVRTGKFSK